MILLQQSDLLSVISDADQIADAEPVDPRQRLCVQRPFDAVEFDTVITFVRHPVDGADFIDDLRQTKLFELGRVVMILSYNFNTCRTQAHFFIPCWSA